MANVISLTGRVGNGAEVKYTPGGSAVMSFTLANDVGYGEHKKTNWFNCQIWGKRAEGALAQSLTKGTKLFISGELTLRPWENKDGVKQISPDINVSICEFSGDKKPNSGQHEETPPSDPGVGEDVPF